MSEDSRDLNAVLFFPFPKRIEPDSRFFSPLPMPWRVDDASGMLSPSRTEDREERRSPLGQGRFDVLPKTSRFECFFFAYDRRDGVFLQELMELTSSASFLTARA